MKYSRFFAMIATSTVVMFGLMYLNTYAAEHVFFSETRVYMAILMGAVMAIVMLAFMLGMYADKRWNIAIFAGAAVVFALSLYLVRSQVTVTGLSYMRAMIPHHSIAVMTSERAGIGDARVRKLADGIIAAQQREIAEMRYLIADVADGNVVQEVYKDPPAAPGTVADALGRAMIAGLDPAPLDMDQAAAVIDAPACGFRYTREADPILWTDSSGGSGAMKLNGVLVPLRGDGGTFSAEGVSMRLSELGDDADWRANADLQFALERGLTVDYRGFWSCL